MFRTNDNRIGLIPLVALLWWQIGTTPGACSQTTVQQPSSIPQGSMPPLLPGQVAGNYDDAMKLGNFALTNKQFQIAADNFRVAVKEREKDVAAHYGLACALAGMGPSDDALQEFFETLRCDPNYAPARFEMGKLFMARESWDEANGQFLQVLKINPYDLPARGNLAIGMEQKGQLKDAIDQLKYIVQAAPKDSEAHYNLAVAYELSADWQSAIDEYQKTLKFDPKNSQAYVQLGNCLVNKGDKRAGEAVQKEAIKINPANYRAYIALGRIYELESKDDMAQEQYNRAIRLAPKAPECDRLLKNMMKMRAKKLGLEGLPGLD